MLGAVYLNEYGKKNALARFIRLMADVMTGVPSIVMALFIYIAVVLVTQSRSGFAASLVENGAETGFVLELSHSDRAPLDCPGPDTGT